MPRAWTEPEPDCALRLVPTPWMSRSPEPDGGDDGGGAGEGDVVVDGDVAVEVVVVVVAVADGDLVAALGDGRVGGDLLDAGVDVRGAAGSSGWRGRGR